ncbi:MAG: diol dehydratase small subunit [Propionibacteriaceae bacterium]|jgi:propanediol dehydratase small subunit|nr:diol dehydratase small subunit [Propionibacteriaceae bacterium]
MDSEELIQQIMAEVLKNLGGNDVAFAKTTASAATGGTTAEQYPLGEKIPDQLKSASGRALPEFTLGKVISGELTAEDFRTSSDVLIRQAEVAESVGREAFGRNLRRAAELTSVPDEEVLAVYNALRPYRSTKAELLAIADKLETQYGCKVNAGFIREAAAVYESRSRLRVD